MAKVHLTDKRVAALPFAAKSTRAYYHDDDVMGLLVSVTDKTKSFMFQTRYPGKQATRRKLGSPGTMNVDEAREKARQWRRLLDKHIDPKLQAERDRLEALRSQGHTFEIVALDFFKHVQAEGLVKAKVIEREIRREFWHLSARPIHEISQHEIAAVINAKKSSGAPAMAHVAV